MNAIFRIILLSVFIFFGEFAHADFTKCLPEKLKNSSSYEMVPMIPGFRAADKYNNVHYYSKAEAEKDIQLDFISGKAMIKDDDGFHPWTSVRNIYVMDQSEKIYVLSANPFLRQNHSSILAGDEVAGAGNIIFNNGKLSFIDNGSGHYKPEKWILRQPLAALLKKGVDISEATIGFGGNKVIESKVSSLNALQFLFHSSES